MTRSIHPFAWGLCVALTALTASAAPSAGIKVDKAPRPTTAVALTDCTSAPCHANVLDHKVIHGPVNVNSCDACHELVSAEKHTYKFIREKSQLCVFCHQLDLQGAKTVHKPVAAGECLQCHEPHGGYNNKFLRGKSLRDTCAACHQDVTGGKKNVHGPVAAGACDSCHTPHASELPKLLLKQGRDLCVTCHKEMEDQLKKAKYMHKAVVEGDCQNCHDPHASNYRMQIKQPPEQLCLACHDKIKKATQEADKHSVVTKDAACLNCHTPHGGDLAHLVRAKPIEMCLNCHGKPIRVSPYRLIPSMSEVVDPKMDKHGPIRAGECSGCHNPHGSPNANLLAKPYPPAFYQKFSLDKYDLCLTCHDKQLVLTENTDKLTGFRNGSENLHFRHVNKAERGRSCRACHSIHASKLPKHLRELVPYGNWQMPINYTSTPTGGSCAPGCHRKFGYDREQPVNNEPEVAPAPAPPSAAPEGKDKKP